MRWTLSLPACTAQTGFSRRNDVFVAVNAGRRLKAISPSSLIDRVSPTPCLAIHPSEEGHHSHCMFCFGDMSYTRKYETVLSFVLEEMRETRLTELGTKRESTASHLDGTRDADRNEG